MTTIDPKIEAVARAICKVWGYDWDGPADDEQTPHETDDECGRPTKQLFRDAARAALAAASEDEAVKATAVFKKYRYGERARIVGDKDDHLEVTRTPEGAYHLSVYDSLEDQAIISPTLTAKHFEALGSVAVQMRAEAAALKDEDAKP